MTQQTNLKDFGSTAQGLAKNPLGIIALFIVMVYGFASLVTAFGGHFAPNERFLLVCFLISFPVLVLAVFTWLVSIHPNRLFGPGDFKNEENYVKMQMSAVASLSAAAVKHSPEAAQNDFRSLIDLVEEATESAENLRGSNHVLWVDDRPENNVYERRAFEAFGLQFTLALSTNEAFEKLKQQNFAAIISDMGRKEGPREGYVLLDQLRSQGNSTPLFFYASSNAPEHKRETKEHGGQGCTNNAQELFQMVTRSVIRGKNG